MEPTQTPQVKGSMAKKHAALMATSAFLLLLTASVAPVWSQAGEPAIVMAVTTDNELVYFDASDPSTVTRVGQIPLISKLAACEHLADGRVICLHDRPTSEVWEISPSAGARQIGSASSGGSAEGGWFGMAIQPSTGTIFANSASGIAATLQTLSPIDGSATLVGFIFDPSPPPGADEVIVTSVAIDSTSSMFGIDIIGDQMVSIDTGTATASPIGSLGLGAVLDGAMFFDRRTDDCYAALGTVAGTTDFFTCDTTTGAVSLVGPIGEATPGVPTVIDAAFLRIGNPYLFTDGFESGDLSAWSATVP